MSGKLLSKMTLSETLNLVETTTGWWIYDTTRGVNIAMHEATPLDAFIYALEYYQRRLGEVETAHKKLRGQVQTFVGNFTVVDSEGYTDIEIGVI